MQAKIYSPTLQHRKEGLKVAERFWTKDTFIRLGVYLLLPPTLEWYDSDFAFPFTFDGTAFAVGVVVAFLFDVIFFHRKKDRAKTHIKRDKDLLQVDGPLQYRLTEAGLDLWAAGEHEHRDWDAFRKFKLTDELLIVVLFDQNGEYWVFPRKDVGEPLLSIVLRKLEESGATRQ